MNKDMSEKQIMTPGAYAKTRNVSRQSIMKHIDSGRLMGAHEQLPNGRHLIDRDIADAILNDTATPDGEGLHKDDFPAVSVSNAKKAYFDALLIELKYRQEMAELVPSKKVHAMLYALAEPIRSEILSLPDKVVDNMRAAATVQEARAILETAIDSLLLKVSNIQSYTLK